MGQKSSGVEREKWTEAERKRKHLRLKRSREQYAHQWILVKLIKKEGKGNKGYFFSFPFRSNCFLHKVATSKIHILKDPGWVPGPPKFYIWICWKHILRPLECILYAILIKDDDQRSLRKIQIYLLKRLLVRTYLPHPRSHPGLKNNAMRTGRGKGRGHVNLLGGQT